MQRRKEEGGKKIYQEKKIYSFYYPSFHFGALLSVKVADVTLFFIQISIKHTAQPDCFLILCLVYRKPDYCSPDQVGGGLYARISTKCFISNKGRKGASCEVHHLNKYWLFNFKIAVSRE